MNHKRLSHIALHDSFSRKMEELRETIRRAGETGEGAFINFDLLVLEQLEDGINENAKAYGHALAQIEGVIRPSKDLVFPQLHAARTDAEKLLAIQDVLEDFQ